MKSFREGRKNLANFRKYAFITNHKNMKTLISLFIIFISSYAMSEDLLKARDWTSADGAKLNATFIETDGTTVKLKRTKDSKTFDLEISKLSKDDYSLIVTAIDQIDAKINNKDFGIPRQINEKDLDLALRLNKHEKLWKSAEGAKLVITPQRIVKVNDKEAILIGDHVAIRFAFKKDLYKFSVNGEKIIVYDSNPKYPSPRYSADRNKPYRAHITSDNNIISSFKSEKIDLRSILTVTYDL